MIFKYNSYHHVNLSPQPFTVLPLAGAGARFIKPPLPNTAPTLHRAMARPRIPRRVQRPPTTPAIELTAPAIRHALEPAALRIEEDLVVPMSQ